MRRRMFRYRLSTLLLVFTLVAVYLGMEANRVAKQKEALKIIQSVGGYAYFDYLYDSQHKRKKRWRNLTTPGPTWLHKLVGENYFRTIVSVSFEHTTRIKDQHFAKLSRLLPHVRSLNLYDTQVTDNGIRHVSNLKKLEKLILDKNNIGNEGIRHLRHCKRLRSLSLSETDVTDAGLRQLVNSKNLEKLLLRKSNFGDEGMRFIGQCTQLRSLSLNETKVTDTGLQHLTQLLNLKTIWLGNTEVSDQGIEKLVQASPSQLRWIYLRNTKTTDAICERLTTLVNLDYVNVHQTAITGEGAAKIRTAFPKCLVIQSSDEEQASYRITGVDRYRPD